MKKEYTPDLRGFVTKYIIYRANEDGSQGEQITGPTFTLRPYDPHARKALLAYAESVSEENPELSEDLVQLVKNYE